MKGLPARSDEPWTARAITSVPTPLSPVIRMGIDDLAARSPRRLTMSMAGEVPIRSSKVVRPEACFLRRSTSLLRDPMERALRIETVIRSGDAGLTKKSHAPACMAWTTVSMPPVAVSTITGWLKLRARISTLDPRVMPRELIGEEFDESLLVRLPASVDPCGERGEFHTCVTAGPMFSAPIAVTPGEVVEREGFVYGDLRLATGAPGTTEGVNAVRQARVVPGTT